MAEVGAYDPHRSLQEGNRRRGRRLWCGRRAGLEFPPDPCPPARSIQAVLASTVVATVASTNRSRSSRRRRLPWNSGRPSRSRRSAAASTPPTQPSRGCRPPGRPHRAPPIEAAAPRSPHCPRHRRSDLKQIDHGHHRRALNGPPRDQRGKPPPEPSQARPVANAPPTAAERHPRQVRPLRGGEIPPPPTPTRLCPGAHPGGGGQERWEREPRAWRR